LGHKGTNTTEIYIRDADDIQAGFGEPFPTLPATVVDPFGTFARLMPVAKVAAPIWLKTRGILRGGRDSKTSKSLDSREIIEGSRHDERARIDVSARELVANGPTESEPAATIEERLALALERASAVGRWDVVAQLARELEARRP